MINITEREDILTNADWITEEPCELDKKHHGQLCNVYQTSINNYKIMVERFWQFPNKSEEAIYYTIYGEDKKLKERGILYVVNNDFTDANRLLQDKINKICK